MKTPRLDRMNAPGLAVCLMALSACGEKSKSASQPIAPQAAAPDFAKERVGELIVPDRKAGGASRCGRAEAIGHALHDHIGDAKPVAAFASRTTVHTKPNALDLVAEVRKREQLVGILPLVLRGLVLGRNFDRLCSDKIAVVASCC